MQIPCPICARLINLDDTTLADNGDAVEAGAGGSSVVCPSCGTVQLPNGFAPTETRSPEDGENSHVAHFSLIRKLGQGSFGTVWLATDTKLGRRVALKVPNAKGAEAVSLLHEAQIASTLAHPNIVTIYEVGTEAGANYIACEFIDGITLRDFLSPGVPSVAKTNELVAAIAGALHHAHAQGIVHRDVKPGNILIDKDGQPFVTDFGLAKDISSSQTISSEGHVLGTARYMSPEQARGKTRQTDHRADIYALGVMLFEMLTGHMPYRGNVRAILHQKVVEDAPSPRKLSPALPKDLETICLKCLEREPGKRFQSALEVAEELQRFRRGEPIKARPVSSLERTWRWCRRRPTVAGLLIGLFLSLSFGLVGVSFFFRQAARSADLTRRALYRSQMNLVAEHLGKGDILAVDNMLDRISADKAMAQLRGFEWYYYHTMSAPFVQTVNQGAVVTDVAVSADGDLLAACGADRGLRIWDAATGELLRTIKLDAGRFLSIDFSPANGHLAAGSSDGMVRFWNPRKEGAAVQQMKHGPAAAHVRFSPNGKLLLSAGSSGAVRVWDVASESMAAAIPTGMSGAVDVRFAQGGEVVVVAAADGLVRIWKVGHPPTRIQTLQGAPVVTTLAISDDGSTIATGSAAGSISIWSAEDGTLQNTYESAWRSGDLEFMKDTKILAAISNSGWLLLYDVDAKTESRRLKTHSLASGFLARSANGKYLVVGGGDGSVRLLRADALSNRNVFWHASDVRSVELPPAGNKLLALGGDGDLRVWNVDDGSSWALGDDATLPPLAAFSLQPHGQLIALANDETTIFLKNRSSGQTVAKITAPLPDLSIVRFSPSGQQLAVVSRVGPVWIYHEANWSAPQFEIPQQESRATAITFSPQGEDIVVAYEDGAVRFYHAADGAERETALQVGSISRALVFCEAGRLLAVGAETGEIHLYDVARRQTRAIVKGHTGRINALAVLPNGTTLVSGGRDKDLKLWDTVSGEQLTTLSGHRRMVFSIVASPDGQTIVSGGLEGDIRIWSAGPVGR